MFTQKSIIGEIDDLALMEWYCARKVVMIYGRHQRRSERRYRIAAARLARLDAQARSNQQAAKKRARRRDFFNFSNELLGTTRVSGAQRAGFAAVQCTDGFSTNFGAGAGVALVNGNKRVDVAA